MERIAIKNKEYYYHHFLPYTNHTFATSTTEHNEMNNGNKILNVNLTYKIIQKKKIKVPPSL